jgi:hypothetical protein
VRERRILTDIKPEDEGSPDKESQKKESFSDTSKEYYKDPQLV